MAGTNNPIVIIGASMVQVQDYRVPTPRVSITTTTSRYSVHMAE
jgi:hypothetical protein